MIDIDTLVSKQFIASVLTALAVVATVITLLLPFLSDDNLAKRMKMVSAETEIIRRRERERMQKGLRYRPKPYMKEVVDRFSLADWLNAEGIKARLVMAGFRGPQGEVAFLFSRFVAPICFLVASIIAIFLFPEWELDWIEKIGVVIVATFAGIKAPELYISNIISRRQTEMMRAFPDALDLMLICVESGLSIDLAMRKVSQEIGVQSVPLAEEFALATAELAYLSERRMAYVNLGERTGIDNVKQVMTVLIQAEKYGTPLVKALRVAAQESREARMMAAEQKAASLPPKLTVPMIVFFLPPLFAVIMGPAVMQIMKM
jgi:tight adherence protein C